jgi:hypothetical protein
MGSKIRTANSDFSRVQHKDGSPRQPDGRLLFNFFLQGNAPKNRILKAARYCKWKRQFLSFGTAELKVLLIQN